MFVWNGARACGVLKKKEAPKQMLEKEAPGET
jgi:hypothetical protein